MHGPTHGRYPFGHPMEFSTNVLFVGDLASSCTEEHIEAIFRSEGFRIVDAKLIRGKNSLLSLNYGFVQMRTAIEAQNAIAALDSKLFYGRKIRVCWSRPNAKGSRTNEGVNSVHVKFQAMKPGIVVNEETLRGIFCGFGNIADVWVRRALVVAPNICDSGYGFVHYCEGQDGMQAAFKAIASIEKCNIIGHVEYACEPSRNLVKILQQGGINLHRSHDPMSANGNGSHNTLSQGGPHGMNPAYGSAYPNSNSIALPKYSMDSLQYNRPPYQMDPSMKRYMNEPPDRYHDATNYMHHYPTPAPTAMTTQSSYPMSMPSYPQNTYPQSVYHDSERSQSNASHHSYHSNNHNRHNSVSSHESMNNHDIDTPHSNHGIGRDYHINANNSISRTVSNISQGSYPNSNNQSMIPSSISISVPRENLPTPPALPLSQSSSSSSLTSDYTLYFSSFHSPSDLSAGCSHMIIDEKTGKIVHKHAFLMTQYYPKSLQPDYEALLGGLLECIQMKIQKLKIRHSSSLLHIQLKEQMIQKSKYFHTTSYRIIDPLLDKYKQLSSQLNIVDIELVPPHEMQLVIDMAMQILPKPVTPEYLDTMTMNSSRINSSRSTLTATTNATITTNANTNPDGSCSPTPRLSMNISYPPLSSPMYGSPQRNNNNASAMNTIHEKYKTNLCEAVLNSKEDLEDMELRAQFKMLSTSASSPSRSIHSYLNAPMNSSNGSGSGGNNNKEYDSYLDRSGHSHTSNSLLEPSSGKSLHASVL